MKELFFTTFPELLDAYEHYATVRRAEGFIGIDPNSQIVLVVILFLILFWFYSFWVLAANAYQFSRGFVVGCMLLMFLAPGGALLTLFLVHYKLKFRN